VENAKLIELKASDIQIKGITKGANAIVSSNVHGTFMISKLNFNKLINNNTVNMYGAIVEVPNFNLKFFKTLKF
jgi:hypothetical protein